MLNTFKITLLKDPFGTNEGISKEFERKPNFSLRHYLKTDGEFVVLWNNTILDKHIDNILPAAGEHYFVTPIPGGGGGELWRTIAQTTLLAASMIIPSPVGPMLAVGSSVLFGYIWLRPEPDIDDDYSQSYAWTHKPNFVAAEGKPMPILYGKTRVKPTIKNRFIKYEADDKQSLNILYSFGSHQIDERVIQRVIPRWTPSPTVTNRVFYRVGDEVQPPLTFTDRRGETTNTNTPGVTYKCIRQHTAYNILGPPRYNVTVWDTNFWEVSTGMAAITDIEINGTPLSNIKTGNTENFTYETRPGLDEQVIIDDFIPLYVNFPQNQSLDFSISSDPALTGTGSLYNYRLTSTTTQNIEATIFLSRGLYGQDLSGKLMKRVIDVVAQYKKINDTEWINFQLDLQLNENFDAIYRGSRLIDSQNEFFMMGRKITEMHTPFSISFKAKADNTLLETGQYDVRIGASTITAGGTGDEPIQYNSTLTNIASISYAGADADGELRGFTYPGEPLLGLKAIASETMSRDFELTGVCERSLVWVHDGVGWTQKAANNHAWAVYDMLVGGSAGHPEPSNNYGAGIPYTRIDYGSFLIWANNITSLEFELNIVFDAFTTIWDAILLVCQEGRGMVFPVGNKIWAYVDKATAVTQMFTQGNIDFDSFKHSWIDKSRKAKLIETSYWDRERSYKKTDFSARTTDWDTIDDVSEPLRMVFRGITSYPHAYKLIRFMLNCNQLLDEMLTFEVDIDALAAQAGDVIEIQHNVPDWGSGCGGRIASSTPGTPDTIVIDQEFTFTGGTSYTLKVRHKNGLLESHDFAFAATAAHDTLLFTAGVWDTLPVIYSPFAIFKASESLKKFRIIEINRSGEQFRKLKCIEYDENVYAIDGVPPMDVPTQILFNLAETLNAQELLSKNRTTGEYESSLMLTWTADEGMDWGEWDVYFRDVDASDVNWVGEFVPGQVYSENDKVVSDGFAFISLKDNNTSVPLIR